MGQFGVQEVSKSAEPAAGMALHTEAAPRTYKVNPREILVQVLHRPSEPIHAELIDSSYTWVDQGVGYQRIPDQFGGWIHVARNWQSRVFLDRKEYKYLLILDADEGVPWWIPFQLASHDLPIVSGVVCGMTEERGLFACVAVKGLDGKARFPSLRTTKTIPLRGTQKVHNAGTGALMIRRDVLEALWAEYEKDESFGQPFGIPEKEQNQAAYQGALPRGEDICFTDRARKLGYDVYVDWECKITHQKETNLVWPPSQIIDLPPLKWSRMAWAGITPK